MAHSLRIFFLLVMLCVLSCEPMRQPRFDEKAEEEAVRAVFSAQQIAWNNGDMEAFMSGYWNSDSLQFISNRGINHGWKETLDGYKRAYPNREAMGTLSFEITQIKPMSEIYFVVMGKFHLTRSIGDLNGVFTLILEKIDGKWVVIYDHTC